MSPAALRLAVVAGIAPLLLAAAEPAARVAPTRPAAAAVTPSSPAPTRLTTLPVTRIGGQECVSLREVAALIGWKKDWVESTRRLTLSDASGKIELTGGSREVSVNGLRLFLGHPVLQQGGVLYLTKTDYQRGLMPLFRASLLGPLLARPRVIVLDPGHGGADQGMENKPLGLREKVLTLDVAQRLKQLLEARGYAVVLTRSDDRQLGPDKQTDFLTRADITNRAKADLFVSIHFNSLYPDTKTSGTEVYTFTRAGQRSDRAWGFGEKDDAEALPSEVNRFDPWSSLLAHALHREVIGSLKTLDRGQKTMHSAVLRGLKCPAVLVESVFLSNDAEARRAATPEYRQQMAEALARGIGAYADALDKISPKPAAPPAVTPSSPKS
jgi:N-acetylmuramoyl-L-alanine amidase